MIIMKNRFYTNLVKLFLVVLMIPLLTHCTKRWEDMNSDPNRLKTIPDEYIFTNAVRGAFNVTSDLNVVFGGQYSHIYVASIWTRDIDKYNGVTSYDAAESIYVNIYEGPVKNAVEVMHMTEPGGDYENKYHYAQAELIAITAFQKITDAFGDVPYSEAGMGKYGISKPKYDTQEFIYSDMVERLSKVVAVLQEPEAADHVYAAGVDPVFDGNVDKWIRFANSFRLHLAMRARFADPAKYEPIIKECLSLPLIENNDQNPTLETSNDPANSAMWNPWYYYIQKVDNNTYELNWGQKFISTLENTNDPRLPFFSTKVPSPDNSADSIYLGIINGLIDEDYALVNRKKRSVPTREFFAKDQPIYMLTAAQVMLYKAEAALFNIVNEDANAIFQDAIRLGMEQWNIDADSIENYLQNEPEASLSGADQEEDFRKIGTQMWIATVPNAYEAWCSIRRTGYPVIPRRTAPNLSKGITDGYMPTRLFYPFTGELSNNGDNLMEAIARMPGGDKIDNKVWWDKRDAPGN
jgi:hypothetical protein